MLDRFGLLPGQGTRGRGVPALAAPVSSRGRAVTSALGGGFGRAVVVGARLRRAKFRAWPPGLFGRGVADGRLLDGEGFPCAPHCADARPAGAMQKRRKHVAVAV